MSKGISKGIEDKIRLILINSNSSVRNTKLEGYTLVIQREEACAKRDVPLPDP